MIEPKKLISAEAHFTDLEQYRTLYARSIDDPEGFWFEQASRLEWFHPPRNVLDSDTQEIDVSWYGGGKLNAAYNCIDRHLETRGTRPRSSGRPTSRASTATSPTGS